MNFEVKLFGLFTLAGARKRITQLSHTDWKNVKLISRNKSDLFPLILSRKNRSDSTWFCLATKETENTLTRCVGDQLSIGHSLETSKEWRTLGFVDLLDGRVNYSVSSEDIQRQTQWSPRHAEWQRESKPRYDNHTVLNRTNDLDGQRCRTTHWERRWWRWHRVVETQSERCRFPSAEDWNQSRNSARWSLSAKSMSNQRDSPAVQQSVHSIYSKQISSTPIRTGGKFLQWEDFVCPRFGRRLDRVRIRTSIVLWDCWRYRCRIPNSIDIEEDHCDSLLYKGPTRGWGVRRDKRSYAFSGPIRQITEPVWHFPSSDGSFNMTNGCSSKVTTFR